MKIGIIGAGSIATSMATTLQSVKGAECYAIASREIRKAQSFADKYGFEKAYGSYADMLSDPEVELVYIATPHSHHYEHIKMCLDHDKHVICEKAFTANARQAEEVIAIAESKGLLLTEAIWTRYMPMRMTINKVIRSGIIGNPTSLSANLGYPLEHVKRMVRPELAGGALLDLGVYVLNFASMVFGDEIQGIVADCIKYDSGVDAQETIMLSYADGKMATLYATMLAQTDRRGLINGTGGYIEIENINNYESLRVYNLDRRVIAEYAAPVQITGYEYEIQSAMQAIAEGRVECPEMPHYETIRMMQLMDSLREAWGIRFPFEESQTPATAEGEKVRKNARTSAAGKKGKAKAPDKDTGARMITEQNVKEGFSAKLKDAPQEAFDPFSPANVKEDIHNMIHEIPTPPIDKRGEKKKATRETEPAPAPVPLSRTPVEGVKSRPSGLRAGTLDEMRKKLENEKSSETAKDAASGFLGDIVLEHGLPQGGQERKVIRIVDEAVSDYVNIDSQGKVTIEAPPKVDVRVNNELLRKVAPNSVPLPDEGIVESSVSEVIPGDSERQGVQVPGDPKRQAVQTPKGAEKESAPRKDKVTSEKELDKVAEDMDSGKKRGGIGRFFQSVFRGEGSSEDDYDDDYLDE